jgi:DNA polymerase/3'-5' exonuclease PolX
MRDAEAFRDLFPITTYRRWEFAGSLRRKASEVGDIEHVVEPEWGNIERGGGLFALPERTNLLFFHLDSLMRGTAGLEKHWYGNGNRWGEKYRGVDFRGFNNEMFLADADNFGAMLLIRTGPADYSQRVVDTFKRGGMYRQMDGYLMHVGSGQPVKVPVPDEAKYLKLAGLPWAEPENR